VLSTIASYKMISSDIARSTERVESQAVVERETAYFLENIGDIKSAKEFTENSRLFNYAMKAFGMSDMAYAKGMMIKAMEGGIDADDALVNKLVDVRYKEFVDTFNFNRHGELTTALDKTKQPVVDRYVRQTLEEQAGEQNEGVRLALYFERKAASITSVFSILADKALGEVVRTALGIPDEVAAGDLDAQAALIGKKLDVADFKDPEKVSNFLQRFAAMWEIKNPTNDTQTQLISLIQPSGNFGISVDTMMAIANLKR
jgi:hypothetical protein